MKGTTKNDILERIEQAIDALQKPDGRNAIDVLLANRDALLVLHSIAIELAVGAYERDRQAARKARLEQTSVAGMVPLWDQR